MYDLNVSRLARVSWRSAPLAALLAAAFCCPSVGGVIDVQPPAYQAPHTRIRLLTGGVTEHGGTQGPVAGIEIVLEPGWKTYWRSPGEGIPPSFSWDESANLKSAEVLWPAPVRFAEAEGTSIGYKERVVLPILITPEDPAKPVSLNLAIAYGVCKDICMPVEAELSLDMDAPIRKGDREDLAAALARVPRRQGEGAQCPHRFLAARLAGSGERPLLRVETAFEGKARGRDLMVEAPQEAALGAPTLEEKTAAGRTSYLFAVAPEAAPRLKDAPLTFTMVSDEGSCETTARVE